MDASLSERLVAYAGYDLEVGCILSLDVVDVVYSHIVEGKRYREIVEYLIGCIDSDIIGVPDAVSGCGIAVAVVTGVAVVTRYSAILIVVVFL